MVSKERKAEQAQQAKKDHARAVSLWAAAQEEMDHSVTAWCAAARLLNADPDFDLHDEDPSYMATTIAAIDAQVTTTARAVAADKETKAANRTAFAHLFGEYIKSLAVRDQPAFIPKNMTGALVAGIAGLTAPTGGPKKDLTKKVNDGTLLPHNGEDNGEVSELFKHMVQLLRDQSERMAVFQEAFLEIPCLGLDGNSEQLLRVISLAGAKPLADAATGVLEVHHAKMMIRNNLHSIEQYLKDTKRADALQKKANEEDAAKLYRDAIHDVTLVHFPELVSDPAARRAILLKAVNLSCPRAVKGQKPTQAAPGEDGEAAAADVPQPVPQPVLPSLEVSLIRDIAKVSRSMSPNRRIRNNRSRSPRVGSSESPK